MSLRSWLFGLLLLAFAISNPLFSQSISGGTVSGTVLDPSQMVVPQTYVEIVNPATGYKQTVMTDDAGQFRFNNVPPNMYHIRLGGRECFHGSDRHRSFCSHRRGLLGVHETAEIRSCLRTKRDHQQQHR